jgi:ATP synthase protein I
MKVFETEPIQLSDQDKRLIAHKSRAMLMWLAISQLLAGLFVSVLFGIFSGQVAALSALAGAASYWLPNTLAALRLALSSFRPQGSGPVALLVIFLAKMLVAAVLLYFVAIYGGEQVNWLAVLLGLIATLKGYVIALLIFGRKFL